MQIVHLQCFRKTAGSSYFHAFSLSKADSEPPANKIQKEMEEDKIHVIASVSDLFQVKNIYVHHFYTSFVKKYIFFVYLILANEM